MAILKMKSIYVYALRNQRKAILEALQRRGVMEIINLPLEDSVFKKEDTVPQQNSYKKSAAAAAAALEILQTYYKEKKGLLDSFAGRKPISTENYYMFVDDANEIMHTAYEIIRYNKQINEARADTVKYNASIESLVPWEGLDVPLSFKGTKTSAAFIGTLPESFDEQQILVKLAQQDPELDGIDIEVISHTTGQTCIFAVCGVNNSSRLENALRAVGFSYLSGESPTSTASEQIEALLKKIEQCRLTEEKCIEAILSYKGMNHALAFIEDYYLMRAEKYDIIQSLANTKHTFIIHGYISADEAEQLQAYLVQSFDAEVELEDARGDEVPVKLKNKSVLSPVESVLATYSYPKPSEIDPTSIMAVFYYFFFGIMFSDAGYGLVMSLACGWALKHFKNMEEGLRKSVKMFFFCGISTMFWGLMFGSFFGDAINVVCKTLLNMPEGSIPVIPGLNSPIWFSPTAEPMHMLMISFLFGIIHLFTGLGISAYMSIRDGKFADAIYDAFSWYLLVGGGILALLSMDMMESIAGFLLPPVCAKIGGVMAIIGAVIIVLFAGRTSTNPFKRIAKGLYGLYGITGYLSDILSYSRLLALGLATGVIAQVFNQIGSMFGSGIIGTVVFIAVFIVGHTLNIGINALGAYVHTNRLQFVEFFGKFYEGGGRKFEPFKINTKHYNIKEETITK